MQKINKSILALLVICSVIVASVLAICLMPTYTPNSNHILDTINLENLIVWHIGDSNAILNTVLTKMQQSGAEIIHTNATPTMDNIDELSLVVFDSNWISQRVNDNRIHTFLTEATSEKAAIIAIGGPTSKFFEILDKAEVIQLGRGNNGNIRNPASFDPPLVGYKLKQATTPYGLSYSCGSIFASNTADPDTMVQALSKWLWE